MKYYGKELILDIHECKGAPFTRKQIEYFMEVLCEKIDMVKEDLHFWDYEGEPEEYKKAPDHLKGISAVQFIKTSNVTIHTLDVLKRVYLNIFSCKDFDTQIVMDFCKKYWEGNVVSWKEVDRV